MSRFVPYHTSGGIVITTINPKGCREHQTRCLRAWRDLGLRVISFNSESESQTVTERYGQVADVHEIEHAATAAALHGRPSPRLKPVIQQALACYGPSFVFIANSDIYPSFRKAPLAIFGDHPAYAFTRKEVISIPSGGKCRKMYRGGLDVFAFTAGALSQVAGYLDEEPCADQMAFGVPGWDFFMGALVARPEVGGIILDGLRFWHRSHRTTYGSIDEFSVYVPALTRLGFVRSRDCAAAAWEFASFIAQQCRAHSRQARAIETIYGDFRPAMPHAALSGALGTLAATIRNDPQTNASASLIHEIDQYLAMPQQCAEGLETLFIRSESPAVQFTEYLTMVHLVLLVRGAGIRRKIKTSYPAGNRHREAIQHILSESSHFVRRLRLLELFFCEYLYYDILNRNDLKALALSCMNDRERLLLAKIIQTTNHEAAHQPAR